MTDEDANGGLSLEDAECVQSIESPPPGLADSHVSLNFWSLNSKCVPLAQERTSNLRAR